MATRPNVTPIAVTTGVGLNGRKTIYYQDPNKGNSASGVFDPPPERQYQTLLAALQGEAAHHEQEPANPAPADILDQENQPPAATPSAPKSLVYCQPHPFMFLYEGLESFAVMVKGI